jgi:hypothetical protein
MLDVDFATVSGAYLAVGLSKRNNQAIRRSSSRRDIEEFEGDIHP